MEFVEYEKNDRLRVQEGLELMVSHSDNKHLGNMDPVMLSYPLPCVCTRIPYHSSGKLDQHQPSQDSPAHWVIHAA